MKKSHFFHCFFAIVGSLFIAQTASAYIQYAYSSDALEWQYTKFNEQSYEEINDDPDGKINFNFSFEIDENLLSSTAPTLLTVKNANVFTDTATANEDYERSLRSAVSGTVKINPDKTINFWNFIFAIDVSDLNESNYLNNLRDHNVRIISAGGATTCNCDRFWEDINITTQRPYNTWIIAATLDNHYRNQSDFDNWTVTEVNVPEPGSLALASIGLLGFLLRRRSLRVKS